MSNATNKNKNTFAIAMAIAALMLCGLVVSILVGTSIERAAKQSEKIQTYQNLYNALGGYNNETRTLILLANNAELRTGGGFIGTFSLLKANEGKLKTNPFISVYSVESLNSCNSTQYPQPEYLKVLSKCPGLRDSSIDIDFEENAKRALYFYQQNTSIPVENVVQITPMVLEKLLEVLGPVQLKDYNVTVTKENFRDTVQLEVEAGQDKKQNFDPKSGIIGSLANQLLQKLVSQDISSVKDNFTDLEDLIKQKHIMLYSKNAETQNNIRELRLSGSIEDTQENYFMYTGANIAANKNSPYIKNTIYMKQTILEDGQSSIDVTIDTTHSSDYRIPYIDPNSNKANWIVGLDSSYIQLVLPANTQVSSTTLPSNSNYKQSEYKNKTLLSYQRSILPLGSQSVNFRYTIPTKYVFGDTLAINTYIQKQAGGWPYELHYSLQLPPSYNYKIKGSNQDKVYKSKEDNDTFYVSGTINKDEVISLVYEK